MKPLSSIERERLALAILADQPGARSSPSAKDELVAQGVARAMLNKLPPTAQDVGEPESPIVICLIYRGFVELAGNLLTDCVTCGVPLQHRPDVPVHSAKLCAFCGIEKTGASQ